MSVPTGKRSVAYLLFYKNMIDVYDLTNQRLRSVPKRMQKYLCPQISKLLSEAYEAVIEASEYRPNNRTIINKIHMLQNIAIQKLLELQYPLNNLWNVQTYEDARMEKWANTINLEITTLYSSIGDKGDLRLLKKLNRKDIKEVDFLKVMSSLHKYTYTKIAHVPKNYYDYVVASILNYIDKAWNHVIDGNNIFPKTKEEYEERKLHFIKAKQCLNSVQTPLKSLWNIVRYSNREMDEWAGMLNNEIKLIQAVLKSDEGRFKNCK